MARGSHFGTKAGVRIWTPDRALREDLRLPERGAQWDGNALTAPPPLSVEFAQSLRVVMS